MIQNSAVYNSQLINDYYDNIISCIKSACWATVPYSYRRHGDKDNIVAG